MLQFEKKITFAEENYDASNKKQFNIHFQLNQQSQDSFEYKAPILFLLAQLKLFVSEGIHLCFALKWHETMLNKLEFQ